MMSFLDKVKQKAADIADEHGTKIKDGIDKAATAAQKKSGKRNLSSFADKAKGLVDKLADENEKADADTLPPPPPKAGETPDAVASDAPMTPPGPAGSTPPAPSAPSSPMAPPPPPAS